MSDKITCRVCGAEVHSIRLHLREIAKAGDQTAMDAHKIVGGDTVAAEAAYTSAYPDAPTLSEMAKEALARRAAPAAASTESSKPAAAPLSVEMAGAAVEKSSAKVLPFGRETTANLHELFELGRVKAAMNGRGEPIKVTVQARQAEYEEHIPFIDHDYVYSIDLLKTVLFALENNKRIYLWGHSGVGKSSLYEQVCARTNRPYIRVQHAGDTESAAIVGQLLANESGTYFEPGLLPLAMKHGWVYCADEYDFAQSDIIATYQAVLEGKPLIIKEAPETSGWRVVRPHPNFRFVATGNTNGSGDESGLYAGTKIQNAASMERFAIVENVPYMEKQAEVALVVSRIGVTKEDATKIVDFANDIRDSYTKGKIGAPISTRVVQELADIGKKRGSFMLAARQTYINRLGGVDSEVATAVAQRYFGE
ncbi:AAA family ATPase [Chitinibacter tainanensis]|uniref:AAA family ATPase n=1 Tax=Chitinibacter tainanensis TaxID=230667 RepID=UPI0004235728|nr:MoxR family ATPase [Chitinibacter tainanensis]